MPRVMFLVILAVLGFASPAVAGQPPAADSRPDVIDVRDDDPDMAAATARARAELSDFFRHLANPGPDERSFGVKYDLAGTGEMIWAGNLVRADGRLTGTLSNVPIHPDYSYGQQVEIPEAAIVDWGYVQGNRMVGHRTTEVLITRMPPEQAAEVRAALGW